MYFNLCPGSEVVVTTYDEVAGDKRRIFSLRGI